MSSFEELYVLHNPNWRQRLARDAALIRNSLRFLWLWASRGRSVRRQLAEAERQGKVLALEDLVGPRSP